MKSNRSNAIAAGILFIIAAVAAMTGRILYGPILADPDYIIKGTEMCIRDRTSTLLLYISVLLDMLVSPWQ